MNKKVTFEISAGYIDWKEILEKLKDVVDDTCKEISSFDITYSENDDN